MLSFLWCLALSVGLWQMAKKKQDEPEIECCVYCEHTVPCVWTVTIGACPYALCKECPPEAEKDRFSYRLRTNEDREKAKEA